MFGALLDKTTGWLDQRLVTSVLLPALAFWAGVGALVATHVGWTATVSWWEGLDSARQVLVAGGVVAALVLFAQFVQALLPAMIRWYEGYWLLRTPLKGRLLRWQQRRWDGLDLLDPRQFARRYREFPPDRGALLPTRLGNVIRAAERYAADECRYGVDAVFFWPRLYPLLPDALRASLNAARASLEQLLFTATLAGLLGLVTVGFAVARWLPLAVWLAVVVGLIALAVLCHRGAVQAAISYGELVRSAFDTHRRTLLAALGLELPTTLEQERALWTAVAQQLYRRASDHPDLLTFTKTGLTI